MGIEHPAHYPEKTALSAEGGAESGALAASSGTVEALAVALLALSAHDRARLAALLSTETAPPPTSTGGAAD